MKTASDTVKSFAYKLIRPCDKNFFWKDFFFEKKKVVFQFYLINPNAIFQVACFALLSQNTWEYLHVNF